jgi:ABC-2 type transport system permease protein
MRTLAFLRKTFLENLREWKILVLALTFAPFFVYLMYGYFSATAPAYRLLVIDLDAPSRADQPPVVDGSAGLLAAWRAARHPDGRAVFTVTPTDDLDLARTLLRNRDADLLVVVPKRFSQRLADFRDGRATAAARLANHADEGNARAMMAMALSDFVAYAYVTWVTRAPSPLELDMERVGTGRSLTEFDLYVPALLVLALIMVMFTAAASLIKEVDRGTMSRLMLSRLSPFELLTAISVNQVLIGLATLALTFAAARSVGYQTNGSLVAVLAVGTVTALGVVALSVIVAAFLSSIFELLTVGCFPFFVLMFFSESLFPLPKISIAQLMGHTVYLNDVLPTSLAVRAFGKVLNHGAGLTGVAFEIGFAAVLTALYFALGGWLFVRRHYRVG